MSVEMDNPEKLLNSWENYEPAPLEFFHARMMELFHELRTDKTVDTFVWIDGVELSNIIAKAKTETYKRYPKQVMPKALLKTEL